jgi:uncharacterized protein YcbK (DUF882 family)
MDAHLKEGYLAYPSHAMKRYCQFLSLNPQTVEQYKYWHNDRNHYTNPLCCMLLMMAVSLFCACSGEKEMKSIRYSGNYQTDFNDLNDIQLEVAGKIGIQPLDNRKEAGKMKGKLVEVKSQKHYEIDDLTHSIPLLIPQAADLLEKIADNFADSLESRHAPPYKIIVTSITRTRADVKALRKQNGNSTSNSTHLYGTTFDISWRRFVKANKSKKELNEAQLKMVLASVLWDLKKEKACYVKHEKNQACFHITVRE